MARGAVEGLALLALLSLGAGAGGARDARAADAPGKGPDPQKRDAMPAGSALLPLKGKVTVRADAQLYVIDGPQVIPPGSEIRVEQRVQIIGINKASLDVQGGLSVHGTEGSWVGITDVDFSPTTKPTLDLHIDMCNLQGCTFRHGENAGFSGGITIENTCIQRRCAFDVRLLSGYLRLMTVEFMCPCTVSCTSGKGKPPGLAIRSAWMKDVTISGRAVVNLRHSEVRGSLLVRDVSDFELDGVNLYVGAKIAQSAADSFGGVRLTKCNLLTGATLTLDRPSGGKVERVKVDKWFFESASGSVASEKDAALQVKDGDDDPEQSVKAVIVTPSDRRHDFLNPQLRYRFPQRGN